MVHEQKIAGYDITVPKHSAFQCETDPMMFKMHMLMSVVARRGGGKGVFTAAVIERLPIDRLILVSPSALSNKELLDRFKKSWILLTFLTMSTTQWYMTRFWQS